MLHYHFRALFAVKASARPDRSWTALAIAKSTSAQCLLESGAANNHIFVAMDGKVSSFPQNRASEGNIGNNLLKEPRDGINAGR